MACISFISTILMKNFRSNTKTIRFLSHLENQEVPSLDQNTKLFKLFTILREANHLIIDTVLR